MSAVAVIAAREALICAALRVLTAERQPADHPWPDAEVAADALALAARDLTRATDALPEGERPIGWDIKPAIPSDCCGGSGIDDMCSGLPCRNPKCPVLMSQNGASS